jgi:hypothetical protein
MCHVTETGEVVCPPDKVYDVQSITLISEAIAAGFADKGMDPLPTERAKLIAKLVYEVLNSPLDDACVGWRAPDALESVNQVLAESPPVMLLFKYFALPGNVMATYFDKKGDYIALRGVAKGWSDLRSACPPPPSAPAARHAKGASSKQRSPKGRKSSR